LSGGQRQRLTLARALYRRPRLLLLDEPTNQLDDATAETIYGNLRSMPGSPAIVVVTHDDRAALRYADQLYSLSEGRLERQVIAPQMAVA
jgi:ABC-type bacteriocin/lantibiotic exporter with double-glycine peptidase domain